MLSQTFALKAVKYQIFLSRQAFGKYSKSCIFNCNFRFKISPCVRKNNAMIQLLSITIKFDLDILNLKLNVLQ